MVAAEELPLHGCCGRNGQARLQFDANLAQRLHLTQLTELRAHLAVMLRQTEGGSLEMQLPSNNLPQKSLKSNNPARW